MSIWYYADAERQRQGPFSGEELTGQFRDGRITPETLVWRDGLSEWQRLHDFVDELNLKDGHGADDNALPAAEPVASTADASPDASPYAPPMAIVAAEESFVAGHEVVHIGFWKRAAALFIDSMVVGFAYYIVMFIGMLVVGVGAFTMIGNDSTAGGAALVGMMGLIYLLYPVVSAAYYAGFESSSKQATLGKMAVGIKVVDRDGRRLSLKHALGRWLSAGLNYLTLYIGYLMAAFTDRKRGLHDMVAGTLVVDRWAYTAHPQWQVRGLGTVAKVILIVMGVLYGLMFLAIGAAILIPMAMQNQ
ncbi:RDD family protein [Pseudoxanthomonas sp. UTMC 1351]|uniref:RDD family protein n=1 Tax=Pseudoxanthomonas sp. UTMC 1351 TaxID=2695853 RepID=UPI0034CF07AE